MNDVSNPVSNVVSGSGRVGYGWEIATIIFGGLAIVAPFPTGAAQIRSFNGETR